MKNKIIVEIINESNNELPKYETIGSSGMDIRANLDRDITLIFNYSICIPTGIRVALPDNYELQVRPRSGLAKNNGLTILNSPGTIDSDYRGEICIILHNTSLSPYTVKHGDRIAQLVLKEQPQLEWKTVSKLSHTDRNEGGLGHTNID